MLTRDPSALEAVKLRRSSSTVRSTDRLRASASSSRRLSDLRRRLPRLLGFVALGMIGGAVLAMVLS
eukprot:4767468-Pleurochrysis_carterae.AAC.1